MGAGGGTGFQPQQLGQQPLQPPMQFGQGGGGVMGGNPNMQPRMGDVPTMPQAGPMMPPQGYMPGGYPQQFGGQPFGGMQAQAPSGVFGALQQNFKGNKRMRRNKRRRL